MSKPEATLQLLNQYLADMQIYYMNLRGLHWNIRGKHFFELHAQFEQLYTEAAISIDDTAERILMLGGTPLHSYTDYLQTAELKPAVNVTQDEAAVRLVLDNLSYLMERERDLISHASELGDDTTADQYTQRIVAHEKQAWMFRAWLGNA
jgi:starvation-inducible DNA-binding protein